MRVLFMVRAPSAARVRFLRAIFARVGALTNEALSLRIAPCFWTNDRVVTDDVRDRETARERHRALRRGARACSRRGAVLSLALHGAAPLAEPHLPWWAIAVGWAVAETCVVHLYFRRSAHSFSLADFPFVFGLAFASGDGFLLGALLGAGAAYAFRRLPPIKLVFNLAQLALAVCVAFVIVRALAEPAATIEPQTWLALYVATLAAGALSIVCIAGAIAIAEGSMTLATVRQMFTMDLVFTAANSSLAIAAAVLISTDARAALLLLVPAAIVFGVYRAYVSERQQHEKLEFLYESNRALTRSPEVAEAIEGVLARSLEAFRSEIAEVVLFSADGTPLRSTLRARETNA